MAAPPEKPQQSAWLAVHDAWELDHGPPATRTAYLQNVAAALRRLQWSVHPIAVKPEGTPPSSERALTPNGSGDARRWRHGVTSAMPLVAQLRWRRAAAVRVARQPLPPASAALERYDFGGPRLVLAARKARVPLAVHVHATYTQERLVVGRRWAAAERHWLSLPDVLWFVSEEVEEFVRQELHVRTPGLVVGNGIDPEYFDPPHETDPGPAIIGMASSFKAYHHPTVLLRATAALTGRLDVTLDLPGWGPLWDATNRERARDAALRERVLLPGWVGKSELVRRMQRWSVAVVPGEESQNHGRSLKLLESAAAGIPIVAADVPGNHVGVPVEFFQPGSASSLADAIQRVLSDPDRASALARRARHAVDGRRWEQVLKPALDDVLRRSPVLGGPGPARSPRG